MACSAPVVTRTWSGSVGRPRSQYLSAMASRSASTPTSSWPTLCRYGVTSWMASTNASLTAAAGADNAAAARLIVGAAISVRGGRRDRERCGAARAAAGVEIAVFTQLGIRRGHGGTGNPQRVGHRAFARQPRADGNAAVDDQQPDGVGQPVVGRATTTGCPPVAKLAGQKVHIERSGVHFDCHRKPVCANWLWNNKPVDRIIWS